MAGGSVLVSCGVEGEMRPTVLDDPRKVMMIWMNSPAFDDGQISLLRGYTGVWQLSLSRSGISSAAIKELDCRVVSSLRLRSTKVDDAGVRWLVERCPNVRSLDLGNTRVTDGGIHWLCGLSRLDEVYLDGTSVSDKAMPQLKKAPRGLTVFLPGTNVTKQGAATLRRDRPDIRCFL
jgi:internalin A